MDYELLSEEDFRNRPDDPEEAFVYLEAICRRLMNSWISRETAISFDTAIRLEYMATVAALATELNVEGISYPGSDEPGREFDWFSKNVKMAVTRIRLRTTRSTAKNSVALSARTRGLIELQIRKLVDIVEEADLTDDRRRAILKKLDELREEVNQSRSNLTQIMVILSSVSLAVASGTSFFADAPQALTTIQSLIGKDKADEEAERERLGAPPPKVLAIKDERKGYAAFVDDLDEDVPF